MRNEVTLFEQIIINGELYSFPHALLIIITPTAKRRKSEPTTSTIKQLISGCLFAINSHPQSRRWLG